MNKGLTSKELKQLKELLIRANNHQVIKIFELVDKEFDKRMMED